MNEASETGSPFEVADPIPDYEQLGARMGADLLRLRLMRQAEHVADFVHQGRGIFRAERYVPVDAVIRRVLKLTGLYWWGNHAFRQIRVVENSVPLPKLAADLDGYRILQLTDLHLDLDPSLTPAIVERLQGLEYDLAVITGDFRNSTSRDFRPALEETRKIVEALKKPVYGILGNHDFIEMVPGLEAMGLPILLNESVVIRQGEARIHLAGIDDPAFYKTYNMAAACQRKPLGSIGILLAHSPDIYRTAQVSCFDFVLCGHTHGGQICLPGGVPLVRNADCPPRMLAGSWEYKGLHGYTSRGTGACGVAVRFFCPPEITLHTLRRASTD